MSNNLTVYCQHGDERFGVLVSDALLRLGHATCLGNPRAFMNGTRYIDTDLNRSYALPVSSGYEAKRAQEIVREAITYDMVIDIHSSYASVGNVAIIPYSYTVRTLEVLVHLGFKRVAVMPQHIVRNSLIGNVTNGISLEYGMNSDQDVSAARVVADAISQIGDSRVPTNSAIQLYHIADTIPNTFRKKGLQNYMYDAKLGGYPFLVGETRYKTYAGFFADRTETVIIRGDND